ncbi:MAG: HDIG domain-containing protein [Candidatus Coatesbacteria bacterium]|nr:HDIG domain-containing protein [Candidatus Coatesbacteria bacterium]
MNRADRSKQKRQAAARDSESAERRRSWRSLVARLPAVLGRRGVHRAIIICAAVSVLSILLVPKRHTIDLELYRVGEIARQDTWAPSEITIEDEETTDAKRKAAAENVPPVYDYDERAVSRTIALISSTFSSLRDDLARRNELLRSMGQSGPEAEEGKGAKPKAASTAKGPQKAESKPPESAERPEIKPTIGDLHERFKQMLQVNISREEFDLLVSSGFSASAERCLGRAFEEGCRDGVVGDKNLLIAESEYGITAKEVGSGIARTVVPSMFYRILDAQEARAAAARFVRAQCADLPELHSVLASVVSQLIKPTLTFNKSETEKNKQESQAAVEPVYFKIKKGQMILRAREMVTPKHNKIINLIAKNDQPRKRAYSAVGTPLFLALVIVLIYLSARRFGLEARSTWKNETLFWSIIILAVLSSKVFVLGVRSLVGAIERFPYNQIEPYYFAAPLGLAVVLATLLCGKRSGLAAAVLASVIVPLLLGNWPVIIMATLLSGVAVVFVAEKYGGGALVFKMGLSIGAVAAATILSMQLLDPNVSFAEMGYFNALCGFGQGVAVIAFTGVFLPILELVFGVWTKSKLRDLASSDKPLLKRLMIEAGGTHNHSIRVGELAHNACEAIGANGVVALVSSYYHDIGKLKRPGYFIENTPVGGENPHDRLTAAMSARVLVEHVTYGLELARKNKLPAVIIDAIEKHHGMSLIRPFLHKALEAAKRTGENVEESEFRYPGPKPRTRETGIIMLADSIEAASRVLVDPTRDKVCKMVDRITSWYVEDNQLDECDLSLRDIEKCKESFALILQGMLHSRIEYPEDQSTPQVSNATGRQLL